MQFSPLNSCKEVHAFTSCTIIPDIHVDAMPLDKSLRLAGMNGRIAFLGDFIDAGTEVAEPDDAAVLERVRRGCDDGLAMAVRSALATPRTLSSIAAFVIVLVSEPRLPATGPIGF